MSEAKYEMKYEMAWHVPSDDPDNHGVLVLMPWGPCWWLICPAAATVYLDDDPCLTDCSDPSCMWDDVHRAADALRRTLEIEVAS
jgi:hypothetical protein